MLCLAARQKNRRTNCCDEFTDARKKKQGIFLTPSALYCVLQPLPTPEKISTIFTTFAKKASSASISSHRNLLKIKGAKRTPPALFLRTSLRMGVSKKPSKDRKPQEICHPAKEEKHHVKTRSRKGSAKKTLCAFFAPSRFCVRFSFISLKIN